MKQRCQNCGARLAGHYCSQCGQAAHESARSLGTLLHGGWHDITHLDGRLWRSCGALLFKPGKLTQEYLANRRQRYLPPFRTYLVLSLLYFALLGALASHAASAPRTSQADRSSMTASTRTPEQIKERCARNVQGDGAMRDRMRRICEGIARDRGASLWRAFLANLPRAMVLLLPLLAAGMLLLYWHPRRLYVEHLVFFLHTHGAAFLLFSGTLLVKLLAAYLPLIQPVTRGVDLAAQIYMFVYLFIAMKRFYAQGYARTVAKYVTLCGFYVFGLLLVFLGSGIYSAYSSYLD